MIKEETEALQAEVEKEYHERLAAIEAEYREKLRAIEIVYRMLASRSSEVPARDAVVAPETKAEAPEVRPEAHESAAQETLIDEVQKLFATYSDRSWNVSSLEGALRNQGFIFGSDNPKGGINTSLRKLVERGIIRTIRHGKGRKPSTYRLSPFQTAHGLNGAGTPATEEDSGQSTPVA